MNVIRKTLQYETTGQFHFIDVTDDVAAFVKESGGQEGMVHVFSPHTTVAVKINEAEDGFQLDFKDFMSELVPKKRYYRHNDLDIRDEKTLCEDISLCINGDSHIIQMLVGSASETIPLIAGKMALGEWQRIFMIEVDKSRPRKLEVSIMSAEPLKSSREEAAAIKEFVDQEVPAKEVSQPS
jgi:secondary thiamine-phosphate synthase enzyme